MKMYVAVRDVMSSNIFSVKNTASVKEAIALMADKKVGSIVVMKDGKPVGILTERDIMRKACPETLCASKVEEFMSSPLVTIEVDSALGQAARIMTEKNIRRLLVTDKGKLAGIITQKDVMRGTLNYFMALASI